MKTTIMRTTSGFTLIETVVVVLLIGLVSLILLPRFSGISGGNLKTVTRHLTGTIQTLRDEAESRQKILRLNLHVTEQKYDASLLKEDGEFVPFETDTLGKVQLPMRVRLKDVTTLRQGKIAEGTAYVYFYPVGRSEKALIHLEEGENLMTMKLLPLSGKVRLEDGYLEEN